jgi:hypothetical protein
MIWRRQRLSTVFFLEQSFMEKLIFWYCFGGIGVGVSRNRSLFAELFFGCVHPLPIRA